MHLRTWSAVACLYAVVTLVMATPFVDWRTLDTASFEGDGRLVAWTIEWVSRAAVDGLPLFDANMFFPTPHALAYSEHMTGLGLLAVPLRAFTNNPVLLFVALWLASFWTNAMAAHLLALRLTGRHDAALIAGLIFGWSYFRVLHLAHLQLQWTAWMPLGVVLLERWYVAPSPLRLLWVAVVQLMQILTSWYAAVISIVLNALWLGWLLASRPLGPILPRAIQLAIAGAFGALAVWPFLVPYLAVVKPGPLAEVLGGSADLASYLVPPRSTAVGRLLDGTALQGRWNWGEQTLFLGWIPTGLALVACGALLREWVATANRRRILPVVFFVLLGVLGVALSLGPLGHAAAPFDLLMRVPGLSLFRAPARFALLTVLAVSMLAAHALAHWNAVAERRWGASGARTIVAALAVAMLVEWFPVGADVPRANVKTLPDVYRALEGRPAGAVMSLPDYRLRADWYGRADYLLYAAIHRRPIVNGYGRGEPPDYLSIVEQLSTFPSPAAAQLAASIGVRYFVVHAAQLESEAPVRHALESRAFRLITRVGEDYRFEVEPSNAGPSGTTGSPAARK